jgi:CDP-glucose 4,6-dehydratase
VENVSSTFWQGKQVLLTGHTGFKGAWLALWLSQMGAKVTGISLPPNSAPNLFELANISQVISNHFVDIRDAGAVSTIVKEAKPEIVLHLAAQALVRPGYKDPLATFDTNVMGTVNVLNALRGIDSVKAVVAVTTDKVYRNLEQVYPYRETDALGGHDPYSASKAASEIVISSYRDSYLSEQGVAVASARAGNVIGGGDWSEDRLIPDAIRAWNADSPLEIRRPNSIRPWQHVLEPLNGYLVLAERLYANSSLAGAYNFGPQTHEATSVRKVVELANRVYGFGSVVWGDGKGGPHEAGFLSLEIVKARSMLGVSPRWSLQETVERTMAWYLGLAAGDSALSLCLADIALFGNPKIS